MTFREYAAGHHPPEHEVMALYHGGTPIGDIVARTGLTVGSIYRVLKKFGGPSRSRPRGGLVRDLHAGGVHPDEAARISGYSPRHVRRLLKGQ